MHITTKIMRIALDKKFSFKLFFLNFNRISGNTLDIADCSNRTFVLQPFKSCLCHFHIIDRFALFRWLHSVNILYHAVMCNVIVIRKNLADIAVIINRFYSIYHAFNTFGVFRVINIS